MMGLKVLRARTDQRPSLEYLGKIVIKHLSVRISALAGNDFGEADHEE
jgi:hypothetical protein